MKNTLKEITYILVGIEAGKKWGIVFDTSLIEQKNQSVGNLLTYLGSPNALKVELIEPTKSWTLHRLPLPLREHPKYGAFYYTFDLNEGVEELCWDGETLDQEIFATGIIFETEEYAQRHYDAILGMYKNETV